MQSNASVDHSGWEKLYYQSVIKNLIFCIQFQILDNALIMQSNASVDHSGWSTESVDCIIKALSRIVLRLQDGGLDFRLLITLWWCSQLTLWAILNDTHMHLTALSKRYQEYEIEYKNQILQTYRKRYANHRFRDPEWSTEPLESIIKAIIKNLKRHAKSWFLKPIKTLCKP